MLHLLPRDDLFPHVEEGVHCPCMPEILSGEIDENGDWVIFNEQVVAHNAWDKRE